MEMHHASPCAPGEQARHTHEMDLSPVQREIPVCDRPQHQHNLRCQQISSCQSRQLQEYANISKETLRDLHSWRSAQRWQNRRLREEMGFYTEETGRWDDPCCCLSTCCGLERVDVRAKIKLLAVLLFKMEGSHRYSDFVVSLTKSVVKHIFASSSRVRTEFPVKMDEQTWDCREGCPFRRD